MSGVRWRKVLTCWNWLHKEYSQFTATLDPAGRVPVDATQDGYQMTGIQLGETPCLPDGGTCQGPGQWHPVPLACDHVCLPHTQGTGPWMPTAPLPTMTQCLRNACGSVVNHWGCPHANSRRQMGIQVKHSWGSS